MGPAHRGFESHSLRSLVPAGTRRFGTAGLTWGIHPVGFTAATPPSGRAKRVAVPDGTICNIVLPLPDRKSLDHLAARKESTRSALLTEVLLAASKAT